MSALEPTPDVLKGWPEGAIIAKNGSKRNCGKSEIVQNQVNGNLRRIDSNRSGILRISDQPQTAMGIGSVPYPPKKIDDYSGNPAVRRASIKRFIHDLSL